MLKSIARSCFGYDRRQAMWRFFRRIGNWGLTRKCPCCGASVRNFLPYGDPPRENAACPICGSLERHRLIWMYFQQRTDLLDGKPKKMLHVAPERQLGHLFERQPHIDYLSGDLLNERSMVKMDITDIQFPDEQFDVIYCSHVLEHVPEDRRAMREFYRVLKPGGWAILQVPIGADTTYEDPTITSPEERFRVFGQADHVRIYGPDYADRLKESDFNVTIDKFAAELPEKEAQRYGLQLDETIHFCRKESS